jgi:rSAM/selenodomain-associated transferase 2
MAFSPYATDIISAPVEQTLVTSMPAETELSIVIPTINEEAALRRLFPALASQRECRAEVIVVDGGSQDATARVVAESVLSARFIVAQAGRASQLNAGAAVARGEFLCFMHADSLLTDALALREGIDHLRHASAFAGGKLYGGHFCLRFRRSAAQRSLAYRYYESKARLNLKGCAHGDQGILLPAALFRRMGGFAAGDELLAETCLADRLRAEGSWLLLPQEMTTSARRFECEGMRQRQTLNAVIMALAAAERHDIILSLPGIYRQHGQSATLDLLPVLRVLAARIAALPRGEQTVFWERIGGYICENAWQLAFFLDVSANFLANRDISLPGRFLTMYVRYLAAVVNSRPAARIAATAARCWLRLMLLPG